MHCPQCGHQQNSDKTRFCTKCGLALGGVREILSPKLSEKQKNQKKKIARGARQGVAILCFSLVVALITIILQNLDILPKGSAKIAFLSFLVVGMIRMCMPFIFSGNTPSGRKQTSSENDSVTTSLTDKNINEHLLPEAQYQPPINFASKVYDTAEIASPPSVTDPTTKLLKNQLSQK